MSLTLAQMQALCQEIQPLVSGLHLTGVVEFNPCNFLLTFDREQHLLLCFQKPFLRFHLVRYPSKENNSSPFVKKLEMLKGYRMTKIELLNDDRILQLTFQKENHRYHVIGEFFPKQPNAYLLDDQLKVIASLFPQSKGAYQLPPKQHFVTYESHFSVTSESIEKTYREKENQAAFLEKKQQIIRELTSLLKRSEKRKTNCENSLQESLEWEKHHHEALLLQSHLYLIKKGVKEIVVPDWKNDNREHKITLDSDLEPAKEIAMRFRRSKKLRLGIPHHQEMLRKTEADILRYQNLLTQLFEVTSQKELNEFQKQIGFKQRPQKIAMTQAVKALPYRTFVSASGLKILVGKTAKDNETVTFRVARGSDWWMHVMDFPGSHVIIQGKKGQEPDQEALLDAFQLALLYSKAKDQGIAEVCLTQCKHVSRFGKVKGKVQISNFRKIRVQQDPDRLHAIKTRKILLG